MNNLSPAKETFTSSSRSESETCWRELRVTFSVCFALTSFTFKNWLKAHFLWAVLYANNSITTDTIKIPDQLCCPPVFLVLLLYNQPHPNPHLLVTPDLFSDPIILPFTYLMHFGFFYHSTYYISRSLTFVSEQYSIVWPYHDFSIHEFHCMIIPWFIDHQVGYLDSFQLLTIIKPLRTFCTVFLGKKSFLLSKYLGGGWLWHMVSVCLTFYETVTLCCQVAVSFWLPHISVWELRLSGIFCSTWDCHIFYFNCVVIAAMWYLIVVFDLSMPNGSWHRASLPVLICQPSIFFGEVAVKPFAYY